MRACVLYAIGDLRLEEVPLPLLQKGEVLVKIGACGICGSDIPRIFKKGTYRFPLIPGHEFAGTVEHLGPDAPTGWLGARVTVFPLLPCGKCEMCRKGSYAQCSDYNYFGSRCNGGFSEYIAVPLWNLIRLPENFSLELAAMCEPAAVAYHAVSLGNIKAGDDVFIAGSGTIGLIAALWCKVCGAERIILSDVVDRNLAFANNLGFPLTVNCSGENIVSFIEKKTGRKGVDAAIDCAGTAGAVENCLAAASPSGRVVLMGNPSGDMVLSQSEYWHILRKELTLKGAWNSSYGGTSNDWTRAIDAMISGRLDLSRLVTHRFSLAQWKEAFEIMRNKNEFSVKVLLVNT
jgi:L-iditol 2-dehydrogenase